MAHVARNKPFSLKKKNHKLLMHPWAQMTPFAWPFEVRQRMCFWDENIYHRYTRILYIKILCKQKVTYRYTYVYLSIKELPGKCLYTGRVYFSSDFLSFKTLCIFQNKCLILSSRRNENKNCKTVVFIGPIFDTKIVK